MSEGAAIIIFARLPVPGKVKTRLAAGVGADAACKFYAACAAHTFHEATIVPSAVPYVYNADAKDGAAVSQWLRSLQLDIQVRAQASDADLGERMRAALQAALDSGHKKVILVGTDIPDLSAAVMTAALVALDASHLVLGPARDGGFYLIGAATPVPADLMSGVTWSTSTVRAEVQERAARLGMVLAPEGVVPELQDIDTLQDLDSWVHDPDTNRSTQVFATSAAVVAHCGTSQLTGT